MDMIEPKIYPPRWYDDILGYFFRVASSGFLPAKLFRDAIPNETERKAVTGFLTLEIVSHCWKYSSMLAYQLSSFVNYPPKNLKAIITVFYSEEDMATKSLLEFIGKHKVENVVWNWKPLPISHLFRRGIGRNLAALSTQADWVWMTDCDIVFHKDCLDTLADRLQGRKDVLLYPRQEKTTEMLAESCPLLQKGSRLQLVDIDTRDFHLHVRDRAKGAFQIIHGDVARAIGYCNNVSLYQTPSDHWCKCYEDRAFRWLAGSQGVPVDVKGVYQIRHIDKGRYKKGTVWSAFRSRIRRIQE